MGVNRTDPASDQNGAGGHKALADLQPPQIARAGRRGVSRAAKEVKVRVEAASSPDVQMLTCESQAALLQHLPVEEIFSLDPHEMSAPNVTVFVARLAGEPMGCVALVDDTRYGEVKRLFVREGGRRLGVGVALMGALEQYCRDIGIMEIRLETSPVLEQAVRLYEALGYRARGPFGGYEVLDSSLFMEKALGVMPQLSRAGA